MGDPDRNELLTSVVVRLTAYNLPRRGIRLTVPDTFAVVTSVAGPYHSTETLNNEEHVIGRTEVVTGSCQPQWTTTIPLTYELGSDCYFRVRLFRVCPNGEDNTENLGSGIFEVGDILGSRNHAKMRRLPNAGVILCRLEQNDSINQDLTFRFRFAAEIDVEKSRLRPLPRFSNAPDTIVEISKQHPSSKGWVPIYRSSPVENSWAPKWDEGQLDLDLISNGDRNQSLRIAVIQHRKKAPNQVLAECETTLRMILNMQDTHSTLSTRAIGTVGFPLYDPTSHQKVIGRLNVLVAEKRILEGSMHSRKRDAPKVVQECNTFSPAILTGLQDPCPTCADFDQRQECAQNSNTPRHPHLKALPVSGQKTGFQRGTQLHMTLLSHAATCTLPECPSANCTKMKGLLQHGAQCHQQAMGGCNDCKRIRALLQIHACQCKATSCPVPNCMALRDGSRDLKMQQAMENRRRPEMNRIHPVVGR